MSTFLETYRKKRDFGATPEPLPQKTKQGKSLAFVVQKHMARQLHYDFRLELDGALKSWAVPKGPSLDPLQKRMAVHVEDHPLGYANFEGVIPPGQYGAGSVIVWDRGRWSPIGDARDGYRQGKLEFELFGEKLSGRWALVRMRRRDGERQEHWLLMKEKDEAAKSSAAFDVVHARPDSVLGHTKVAGMKKQKKTAPAQKAVPGCPVPLPANATKARLPTALSAQLATLVAAAPSEPGWAYEVKFDGYRILTRIDASRVQLFTRNGHDWSAKMPALVEAVARLGLASGWLDGEVVVLGDEGQSDFQALQNALDAERSESIRYFIFDLPYCAGYDLRELPLATRRAVLSKILAHSKSERLCFSEAFEASGSDLLEAACGLHLEGIIGKRVDAPYRSMRSRSWIKLKCTQRQEFVVGGYTDPKGARTGIGALLLGFHDESGALRYAGDVGTGFDESTLRKLSKKLQGLAVAKAPFVGLPRTVKAHWVRPSLVAEVSFHEWTKGHRVRQAVFHGLRDDKPAVSVTQEVAAGAGRHVSGAAKKTGSKSPSSRVTARKASAPIVAGVAISHGERVIDAKSASTKLDLVRFYERIAPRLLLELLHRPVSLVRAPDGIGGEIFFQKHSESLHIGGTRQLNDASAPGEQPFLEITSEAGIVGAAQYNVIEFHTWNATRRNMEKPDRMVLDLDPGAKVPFEVIGQAAFLTKTLLDEIGLESFLKTSGGKGLHVVVPIAPRYEWDTVKEFSKAIVLHLARTIPQRFVAQSGAKHRVGRIFVDYLRNGRGATTAAAYSARARPGLGVSTPLEWQELEVVKSADQWTIFNVFERLDRLKRDPWEGYAKTRPTLTAAFRHLQFKPAK